MVQGNAVMEICVEEPKRDRTLVLVGRTGNGKSATGNSILGSDEFTSKRNPMGVTKRCDLRTTRLEDGQIINVIDTPGLFDLSLEMDFIASELVRCLSLAKDGIDAVLLVFSVQNRLTKEEQSSLLTLRALFGHEIFQYIIVVFTGGDELEADKQTLQDYLTDCPDFLKEILKLSDNRMVLFNNRTTDERKKAEQVKTLLKLVDSAVRQSGGKPYTDELHQKIQRVQAKYEEDRKEILSKSSNSNQSMSVLMEQLMASKEKEFEQIKVMMKAEMIQMRKFFEEQLAEERSARIAAEKRAKEEQRRSKEEIQRMRAQLAKANDHSICHHL